MVSSNLYVLACIKAYVQNNIPYILIIVLILRLYGVPDFLLSLGENNNLISEV